MPAPWTGNNSHDEGAIASVLRKYEVRCCFEASGLLPPAVCTAPPLTAHNNLIICRQTPFALCSQIDVPELPSADQESLSTGGGIDDYDDDDVVRGSLCGV